MQECSSISHPLIYTDPKAKMQQLFGCLPAAQLPGFDRRRGAARGGARNANYLLHVGKVDIMLAVRLGKTQAMTVATLAPPPPAPSAAIASFPKAEVEACLRDELITAVTAEASIKGLPLPAAPTQVAVTPFQINSLVVVSILCTIEPIVGFELPDSIVRAGGYVSIAGALEHLLPRIEKFCTKGGKA